MLKRNRVERRVLPLCIIACLFHFGCMRQVKDGPIERMGESRPSWLKAPSGRCSVGFRCVVVQGQAVDLTDARMSARGKGVTELAAELAVKISSRLVVDERQRVSDGVSSERTELHQALESRVKGQLTGIRTLGEYWERDVTYTSQGAQMTYRAWLTVGVPVVVLNALKTDAAARTQVFASDAELLLRDVRKLTEQRGLKSAKAKRLLSRARELVDRQNLLIIDTPEGASKLDEALRRLHEGINVKVLGRRRVGDRAIRLRLKVSLFKAALRGERIDAAVASNGQVPQIDMILDKAGTAELTLNDVRGMKPIVLTLTVGKHKSLRKEITVAPELTQLPVDLHLTVNGRRLDREFPASVKRTILEKFKHLVECRRTRKRCLRLDVDIRARPLGNPTVRQVHQMRGEIKVKLQSPFDRPAYTVEKSLVGLGSSTPAASRDFERRMLVEVEEIFGNVIHVL
ncbi:MAG: hypothetical protein ACPGQS_09455 [Bradymonadia bacterium]